MDVPAWVIIPFRALGGERSSKVTLEFPTRALLIRAMVSSETRANLNLHRGRGMGRGGGVSKWK